MHRLPSPDPMIRLPSATIGELASAVPTEPLHNGDTATSRTRRRQGGDESRPPQPA